MVHHLATIGQSLHQYSSRVTLAPRHLALQSARPTFLVRGLVLEHLLPTLAGIRLTRSEYILDSYDLDPEKVAISIEVEDGLRLART